MQAGAAPRVGVARPYDRTWRRRAYLPHPGGQRAYDLLALPRAAVLEFALVGLVVLIGGVLRLANLLARDPFVDEVNWVHWAARMTLADLTSLWAPLLTDGRPPLFAWVERLALRFLDNGFVAGRVASALPAAVSVLGVYAFVRQLFGFQAGLVAALLWAISPLAVFFGRIASDDGLLSLWAILTAVTSVTFVKRQTVVAGAACGLCMGLMLWTKTLGVLLLPAPIIAWLVLARPRFSRRLAVASLALVVALLIGVSPLLRWLPQISAKAFAFVDLPASSATSGLLAFNLLEHNVPTSLDWLGAYVGAPLLLCAALGACLGIVRRDLRLLFLLLLWVIPFAALMDRTTQLYSRYLLFFAFPLFGLASASIVWLATAAPARVRPYLPACLGLLVAAPVLRLTFDTVTSPQQAELPLVDEIQYFNQWYAFVGLGRIADLIRADAVSRPAIVIIPEDVYPQAEIGDALQIYLRRDPDVSVVHDESLNEGWSACPLAAWLTDNSASYVVLNWTDPENPFSMAAYTETVETALARDLPQARLVASIPRPLAGAGQLLAYRLAAGPSGASCSAPTRLFGSGWREIAQVPGNEDYAERERLLGTTEPTRWTDTTADYGEGPLPAGQYEVELYARTEGALDSLQVRLNGALVIDQQSVDLTSWRWISGSQPIVIEQGGDARVAISVQRAPARLLVARLLVRPMPAAAGTR